MNIMRKLMARLVVMIAFLFALALNSAQASYGTNITNIADDASALFTAVSAVAVTIVAFRIGLWVVRKIRS